MKLLRGATSIAESAGSLSTSAMISRSASSRSPGVALATAARLAGLLGAALDALPAEN